MKTLQQIRTELEDDPQTARINKMVDGSEVACSPDERTSILDDRAQNIFEARSVPESVSFRGLAFALHAAGLYQQVKAAALANLEGEIWWNTAQSTTVRRDHPFVVALTAAIGQTDAQLDAIFVAAANFADS